MLLSKNEELVYRELKKYGFVAFKIKDIRLLFSFSKTKAYNIIKSLKRKKIIKKVQGFFVFKDANEFVTGCNIHYPSYISFWSALNYYGWSDNMPKKIFLATTKYNKGTDSFKYVTLNKNRFFGYIRMGEFAIAEKEKSIIDSLLFPKYAGGMREIRKCLENGFDELDKKKLIDYALKVESRAVIRRLGFLLENLGYKKVEQLRKHIGSGYEYLDSSLKKKNMFDKKWLLDINW